MMFINAFIRLTEKLRPMGIRIATLVCLQLAIQPQMAWCDDGALLNSPLGLGTNLLEIIKKGDPVSSGVSVGNGGQVVMCGDDVEVLDLFEGRVLFGYEYGEIQNSPEMVASEWASILDRAIGGISVKNDGIAIRVARVVEKMKFVKGSLALVDTKDAGAFYLPQDCRLGQVINFRNPSNILVDESLWLSLREIERAALLLHEAVYWYLRDSGVERDSRRTRRIVAFLAGGGKVEKKFELVKFKPGQTQYCRSVNYNFWNDWDTKLWIYLNSQMELQIQVIQFGGYRMLSLTRIRCEESWGPIRFPLRVESSEIQYCRGYIESAVDEGSQVELRWGMGEIKIRGELQPGQLIQEELKCHNWQM